MRFVAFFSSLALLLLLLHAAASKQHRFCCKQHRSMFRWMLLVPFCRWMLLVPFCRSGRTAEQLCIPEERQNNVVLPLLHTGRTEHAAYRQNSIVAYRSAVPEERQNNVAYRQNGRTAERQNGRTTTLLHSAACLFFFSSIPYAALLHIFFSRDKVMVSLLVS
jgi:hypothetical protein